MAKPLPARSSVDWPTPLLQLQFLPMRPAVVRPRRYGIPCRWAPFSCHWSCRRRRPCVTVSSSRPKLPNRRQRSASLPPRCLQLVPATQPAWWSRLAVMVSRKWPQRPAATTFRLALPMAVGPILQNSRPDPLLLRCRKLRRWLQEPASQMGLSLRPAQMDGSIRRHKPARSASWSLSRQPAPQRFAGKCRQHPIAPRPGPLPSAF